jgi:hypothetical protein
MNRKSLLAAFFAAALPASAASAALIGVDFDSTPFSSPPDWNIVTTSGTYNDLIDEDGATTDIDVGVFMPQSNFPHSINASTIPIHSTPLTGLNTISVHPDLAFDISGLNPDTPYKFYLFGLYDQLFGSVNFTAHIQGAELTNIVYFLNTAGALHINGPVGSSANTLESYALTLTSSNTGHLLVDFDSNGGFNGEIGIAGFAIEAIPVPEPAALALLALAAPSLLLRRRRA